MTIPIAAAVTDSLLTGLNEVVAFLPNLVAFLVILAVGYIVAAIGKKLITSLLSRLGVDKRLTQGPGGRYIEQASPQGSPSALLANVVRLLIVFAALVIGVGRLGIPEVTAFFAGIVAFLPNLLAALLIFLVAGALAGAIGGVVARTMGDTSTGKVVGSAAPALIMTIAVFMILTELGIAEQIVQITYVVLLGSIGLGLALAFGLGGRDTASKLISDAYDKGQRNQEQVRQEMRAGKERGRQEAREKAPADSGSVPSRPRARPRAAAETG
ncbi:MAG TPA: hypothetical protein VGV57_05930 [Thermoleophilaceae bacterium]|nr:hypothetical protein [Thermoleophilaceae bacterium]